VIGQLLAMAWPDRAVLARIGGRIGEAAREAADELAELDSDERRLIRAKIAAAARAPMPTGIRGVHPSWIEAGLVGLPPRARTALASGGSTGEGDGIDVWLVRWACAEIPPMPGVDPELRSPSCVEDALRLSGDMLVRWLAEVGADQLAHALRKAGRQALVAVASRVIGDRLLAASVRIDVPPRANQLGPVRSAIARCRGSLSGSEVAVTARARPDRDELATTIAVRTGELAPTVAGVPKDDLLVRIGARAIAPYVDALGGRQLAVRLPRPLGLVVRDELAAHAGTPVDESPTWSALAAAW
jgi:hypothetical protein